MRMMMRMMGKFQKIGRIRKLHTIISQESIKPSSPTPPHLKTRYLSPIDHFVPNIHLPMLFFYKNYNGDINVLKKSLSESLRQYYPFAGRLPTPSSTYIDCNDAGVEFLEASIDGKVEDFILKKEQDETIDQLIPHALGCAVNKSSPNMAEVQLNHFACGGAAVAVTVSHKVSDAFTEASFINHWATVARGGGSPPVNPTFISSPMSETKVPEYTFQDTGKLKFTARRLVFRDSKLRELKNKINGMGPTPVNPTRVEALTSLLFKCSVNAATAKSGGHPQPSYLNFSFTARKDLLASYPELVAGNISVVVSRKMVDAGEGVELNQVIAKLREERMKFKGISELEEVEKTFTKVLLTPRDNPSLDFSFTSLCRFPFYQIDFGWGKPVQVMEHVAIGEGNNCILMDTPSGDGIEATLQLEQEAMAIFRKDKELLQYVEQA